MGIESALSGHSRLILAAVFGIGLVGLLLTTGSAEPSIPEVSPEHEVVLDEPSLDAATAPPELVATAPTPATPAVETRAGREELAGPRPRTRVQVYCVPTVHRAFASLLERQFEAGAKDYDLVLHTRTDRDCVGHLLMGNGDLAIISSELSPTERSRGASDQVIAHQIVVPVVHPDNPIESIPFVEFQALVHGKHTNWRRLGGEDLDIQVVCKHRPRIDDAADRTLRVTAKAESLAVFLGTPREILAYVANHPRAFGLVSLPHAQGDRSVRALEMSQIPASAKAFQRGVWPLGATIRGVLPRRPSAGARAFLDYLLSEPARKIIRRELTLSE